MQAALRAAGRAQPAMLRLAPPTSLPPTRLPAPAAALAPSFGARGMAYLALNNLQDNPGARKNRKRVGRGAGSGLGKTSGRGMKGQKARAGNKGVRDGFEGGQTPMHRTIPKWGFTNNRNKKDISPLNLGTLQRYIDTGRIDSSRVITMKQLHDSGICGKVKDGVKLLGSEREKFSSPIVIEVTRASKSAIEAIEAAGGVVVTAWYNELNLQVLLKPQKYHPRLVPRRARPPDQKEMQYYLNYENRGYLSPQMQFKLKELGLDLLHIPYPFETVEEYDAYVKELKDSKKIPHVPRPAPLKSPFPNPLVSSSEASSSA